MRRTVLAVIAVVSLALAAAAPAAARSDVGSDAAARARAAQRQRILDYWTPARLASAVPRDIVVPLGTRPQTRAKGGKPGGGGGGGGGTSGPSTSTTGAKWTFGGPVAQTTGKVFFTLGGTRYVCSGSAVQSTTANLVVSTAGHCVHEGDGSGSAGYATNFVFYPAWSGSTSTATAYTGVELVATANWQARGAANQAFPDDAAFVRVSGPAWSTPPPAVSFTSGTGDRQVFAFGYPAAQKYKGNDLIYCSGGTTFGYDGDDTLSLPCGMTGGSSGGPWFESFSTSGKSGTQMSVNSYGYSGLTRMFGPVFDSQEQAAYNEAVSG